MPGQVSVVLQIRPYFWKIQKLSSIALWLSRLTLCSFLHLIEVKGRIVRLVTEEYGHNRGDGKIQSFNKASAFILVFHHYSYTLYLNPYENVGGKDTLNLFSNKGILFLVPLDLSDS